MFDKKLNNQFNLTEISENSIITGLDYSWDSILRDYLEFYMV
jgi:hypothetical protein